MIKLISMMYEGFIFALQGLNWYNIMSWIVVPSLCICFGWIVTALYRLYVESYEKDRKKK